MKKTKQLPKKILAFLLVVMMLATMTPVSAATGGATVTVTDVVQYPGVYVNLGGTNYLCVADLGQPVINSGSETALTGGTTITFDLYFYADNWYPVRVPELQGAPQELFVVRVDKTAGGDLVSEPVWKTYPDDGYGERYYLELVVEGSTEATSLDITVSLTQPGGGAGGSDNIGAAYRIQGAVAAQDAEAEMPSVPIRLGGTVYDCITDFGAPDTSTGGTTLKAGDTVNFPLLWVDGSGKWYTVCYGELQGDPATLLTVKETITAGGALLGEPVWKYRGDYNSYYLEYTVLEAAEDQTVNFSVQLTQPDKNREGSILNFTGTYTTPVAEVTMPSVPISLGGTVYDCITDFGAPDTSTGDTDLKAGDTVNFPLLWVDGSGNWYTVCYGELQGDPTELLTVVESFTAGDAVLGEPVWKYRGDYNSYYLEYTVLEAVEDQEVNFSVQLTQPDKNREGSILRFSGTYTAPKPEPDPEPEPEPAMPSVPIKLGGTVYDCITDFGAPDTSTGGTTLKAGDTVNFPLLWVDESSNWWTVCYGELQGDPTELLTVVESFTAGDAVLGEPVWKYRGDYNSYYLEYTVLEAVEDQEVNFSVQLTQPDKNREGSVISFIGTYTTNTAPVMPQPTVPIKLGDTVYDCIVDFGDPVTSTGKTDMLEGDTVCFPLQWVDGSGNWWTVCYGELQGDPAELFEVVETFTAGGQWFGQPVWKHDWAYNSYYLEYKILDPDVAQDLEISVQIKQSETKLGSVKSFAGTVDKRFDLWADRLAAENPPAENQGKVILMGTSTVEQWTQYATHLVPLDALNFGMGGSRVEHIADKNDLLLTPYEPQAVVVYTGGNDIMLDGQTGEEVTAEVKAYLTSVLNDLPGTPVFFVGGFTTLSETQDNTAQRQILIAQLKAFCEETENLYFIDGATPINGDPKKMPELFKEDGIHLNSLGYSLFGPVIAGEVCAVLGVEPENPDPEPEEDILLPLSPIKLGGTVYDCLTTFGAPMTSTGTTQLSAGDTVCFPLVWMDANGTWYTVCYGELQGDPSKLYKVSQKTYAGGALLSDPVWKHDWEYNAYYLEYRVSGNTDGKLDFALTLEQPAKGRKGEPSRFTGKYVNRLLQDDTYPQYPETMVETNVTYTREPAKRYCGADFTIAGVNYAPDQWAVELIEPRTEGGGDGTLYAGSTIIFELYYKTNAWYPVRRDEINQPPEELLDIICEFVSGEESFTEAKWVEIDNQAGNFWGVALEAKPVEEVTEFEFSIGLTQNNGVSTGSVYTCKGTISPGTPYSQVPMSAGAAMAVERLEECRIFPQTTFTLNGVKYSEKWPIDLAAPTSTDAILTDDSVIYADLMFHVGGAWYALRKPEVNEPIEDMVTFEFQILEGAECLGEPRLVTRNDGYSDIWNIEIPVNSHKEVNEFCFTIQLLTQDGQRKGSKYQVRGIVQDDEIALDVQPTEPAVDPAPSNDLGVWAWAAAGAGILAIILILIFVIAKKRKKN